jgi:hypothetical protein
VWNDIEDVAERALAEVERLNAALRRIATYDVCVEHGYTDEWTDRRGIRSVPGDRAFGDGGD